ncbi:10705_t:CDS:2, partial [Racocetra persica]
DSWVTLPINKEQAFVNLAWVVSSFQEFRIGGSPKLTGFSIFLSRRIKELQDLCSSKGIRGARYSTQQKTARRGPKNTGSFLKLFFDPK